eukprot:m.63355 g.63355  ORF g.63355 m.63355 type:complete len:134 (-) comp7189_c0_seq2:1298-1699(-)
MPPRMQTRAASWCKSRRHLLSTHALEVVTAFLGNATNAAAGILRAPGDYAASSAALPEFLGAANAHHGTVAIFPEFHQLVAISQRESVPVPFLDDGHLYKLKEGRWTRCDKRQELIRAIEVTVRLFKLLQLLS